MDSESTILIAVLYNGTWFNGDDGRDQFKDYQSQITEIPIKCTYAQLMDEVYAIVKVDRDLYNVKMKFHYTIGYQPCAPQEITEDRDVKMFIRAVRDIIPVTPLYVEIVPRFAPFYSTNDTLNYGTGSTHMSTSCRSKELGERERKGKYVTVSEFDEAQLQQCHTPQSPQSPIRESENIWENASRWQSEAKWQTQVPERCTNWETGVPFSQTHLETDFPTTEWEQDTSLPSPKVRSDCGTSQPFPIPNVACEGGSDQCTTSSSRYIDINSGSCDSDDFQIGQVYDDKQNLKQKLHLYAVRNNFQFKVVRSSTTRYEVHCSHDYCDWKVRAKKIPRSSTLWIVKECSTRHACVKYSQAFNGPHKQATSRVLGNEIKDKYDGIARVYKPNEIKFDMKLKYGIDISYDKAWRAREHALNSIRGTAEESFTRLPSYFAMLEARNPGTITHIATDDGDCFKYCFMALGASIRGFHSNIRSVVAVDGTTLKHRYRGYLYIASAVDGNGQIFPLAFGVGDAENEDAYTWFFQCFKQAYGEPDNLAFVSDRHKGIENALKVVYPNSYHGLCMYHISQNLKAKKFAHEDEILPAFYLAAKAYLPSRFDYYMDELRNTSIHAYEYLSEIEVERWARCKFPVTRYNIMTTNIAECMNAILRDGREMPLVPLLETIRTKLQQWFYDRRNMASNMTTALTTWTEEILKNIEPAAQRATVQPINHNTYRVIGGGIEGTVNLSTRSCTCRKFDMDQYPCVHGMAACLHRRIQFHNISFKYYHTKTLYAAYSEAIYPVGDTTEWEVPYEIRVKIV